MKKLIDNILDSYGVDIENQPELIDEIIELFSNKRIVIEDYDSEGNGHWGVSFTNSNPNMEDYVECKTKYDAFKPADLKYY